MIATSNDNYVFLTDEEILNLSPESSDYYIKHKIKNNEKENFYALVLQHKKYKDEKQVVFNNWIKQILKVLNFQNISSMKQGDGVLIKVFLQNTHEFSAKVVLNKAKKKWFLILGSFTKGFFHQIEERKIHLKK